MIFAIKPFYPSIKETLKKAKKKEKKKKKKKI